MGGKLWDYTDGVTKTEKKKESWIEISVMSSDLYSFARFFICFIKIFFTS